MYLERVAQESEDPARDLKTGINGVQRGGSGGYPWCQGIREVRYPIIIHFMSKVILKIIWGHGGVQRKMYGPQTAR